jgi:hypothetical protein
MTRREPFDSELAGKVLGLRRAGVPFDKIATELNLTPRAAQSLFEKALGTHDPEFQRVLEADRLDRLHAAVWPKALQGELDAVDRVLRISERREKVAATPKENKHELREAFDASVKSSPQIEEMDSGLVASGRHIADRVDEAVATGEGQEVTKALYLVPHMVNVLRELLVTPASREATKAVTPPEPRTDGKLAQLRSIQNKRPG